MNILTLGDIVGRSGREAVQKYLPKLIEKENIHFVIANGENSASGFGITKKIYDELISYGVHCITLGNHSYDKSEIMAFMEENPNISLIRPLNFLSNNPGKGFKVFDLINGKKILVTQVHTKLFINLPLNDPFEVIDKNIIPILESQNIDLSVLEIHGEATSEKNAIANYYDGKFNIIYGIY